MDDLPFEEIFSDCLFLSDDESKKKYRKSKQTKRADRYNMVLERRRCKRADEHKRRRRRKLNENVAQYKIPSLIVAIDFGICEKMSVKELRKMSRQLGRVWGLQKKFDGLRTTLISPTIFFLEECRRIMNGFDNYNWTVTYRSVREEFPDRRIVYLSPDAELSPLLELNDNCVYVIGGLVDESGVGSKTRHCAESEDFECYRLPINDFMHKTDRGSFNVMLPINLVVEILCKYAHSHDWTMVLGEVMPKRTGFSIV